jgi:hypothetical protein
MRFSQVVCSAIIAVCSTGLLCAQSELATLTGTVTDPSGAVLPRVAITVTNAATNVSVNSVTNDSGRYFVPSLKPGVYSVSASLSGFSTHVNSAVTLQVNEVTRLDIPLTVGDTKEQVTVTADAPVLEVDSSNRGAVIDERKIVELPLNGRDYNQLATLSPGVLTPTPRLQSIGFKGAFNVNGNRAFQNAFLLDGVDNVSYSNSYRGNNVQVVQPSIDALQEFKIQTNAYSAEFGRSAGALVNAVIKSGTNSLHGSLYEFFRNRDLDASNFFSNKSGSPKPFRLRNQFGATAGGPIIKNKLFIFGDYEGLRDRTGTVYFSSVPQPSWALGRFNSLIVNPFNPADKGTDFLGAATPDCNDGKGNCWTIPSNMIDKVGQKVAAVNPAPNTGTPGQLDNNYVNTPINRTRTDQFDVRGDYNVSSKLALFGRYSFVDTNQFIPAPRPGLAEGSFQDTFGQALWRSQALAAGATWTLAPTVVSEFRFGYSRGNYFQNPPNFGTACPDQLIGLKGVPTDPSLCGGLPIFDVTGSVSRRIGRTTSQPQFQTPRSYDTRGTVSWNKSNHSLKFGAELLNLSTGIRDVSAMPGRFGLSGRFTGGNGIYQNAFADLLLGLPTRYQQDSNTVFNIWQKIFAFYAQDDWKVNSKLTLNVGLRYEFAIPPRERNNQWANFDAATQQFVLAKSGDFYSESLIHPDMNDFAPRVGFAYSVTSKTVIRSAYGIFYNHSNRQGREGLLGFNLPFIILGDLNITGSGNLLASQANFQLQDGVPAGIVDINKVNLTTVGRKAQDPFQRSPYVQQWNFSIQRELIKDTVLDVAYVGNKGTKLPAFSKQNKVSVGFNQTTGAPVTGPRPLAAVGLNGDIQVERDMANSNYNALQARLEKRFSAGLSFLTSYTWGKALTNAPDHLSTSGVGNGVDVGVYKEPQNPYDRRHEYGPAEFDVQQRFVASAVWQLPYGHNRKFGASTSKPVDYALGGWEFSPILTAQTGLALTINQPELLSLGGERRSRPNRIGDGALPDSQRTVDQWFNTSAFLTLQTDPTKLGFVPFQAYGNSGIGILRGPGLVDFDFNLNKTFAITERASAQLRAEFFNAFNHPNFNVPGITLGAGFGQIVSTSTEARIIQFALKLKF